MSNLFKNSEAIVHQSNKGETTVFPKNSIWYKIGFDTNMVTFRSRYNDEVIFYENDVTELAINGELVTDFVTEFNKIAYGESGGKPEIDYDLLCIYNVTSTTYATSLSYVSTLTKNVEKMYIDDVEVSVGNSCKFDEVGEHVVKYKLVDNTSIGSNAFRNCTSLISVTLPSSVTFIGSNAFYSCTSLKSINIPDSLETINVSTFSGCTNLSYVTFGNSVRLIDSNAFTSCKSLKEINIPDSVETIGDLTFNGCTSVSSITIGSGLKTIGNGAFVTLSDINSIQVSEDNQYFNSRNNSNAIISTITNTLLRGSSQTVIPDGVTKIGDNAFNSCKNLTELVIPDSVTSIEERCFAYSNLTSITFHSSTAPEIGTQLFFNIAQNGTLIYPCNASGYDAIISQLPTTWSSECFSNEIDYDLLAVYNVTSTTESTRLSSTALTSNIAAMYINDVEVEIGNAATFSETGEHVVKYKLIDNTTIGSYSFLNCSGLTEINIPDSVISIDGYAFSNCSNLTSVTFGESITSIGDSAFLNCSGLTEINIPDSVISIDGYAFKGCNGLTSITIGDSVESIGGLAFQNCSSLTSITCNAITAPTIGVNTFYSIASNGTLYFPCGSDYSNVISNLPSSWSSECFSNEIDYDLLAVYNVTSTSEPTSLSYGTYLTSNTSAMYIDDVEVAIVDDATFDSTGEHVVKYKLIDNTSIGNSAFEYCDSLTEIVLPSGVTIIGQLTFNGCRGLTSVTIPNSVTKIGDNAFQFCSSLTSIDIPDSVTKIGNSAFQDCTSLTEINIPNSVTSIGSQAFQNCSLTEINIPNSVTSIGYSAFFYCTSLTSVTIPNSVETIKTKTFQNCTSLTEINIPNSITSIEGYAFNGCTNLSSVTIGNSVTSIGSNAFSYCSGLTSINIPDGVTNIDNQAFYQCSGLTSVTLGSGVISIGGSAFQYCKSLTSITCNTITAPTIGIAVFNTISSTGMLYYPCLGDYSTIISNLPSTWASECFESDGIYEYDITAFVQTASDERNEKLFDTTYTYFQDSIDKMYINGVEITPTNEYVFAKAGTHVVKYLIKQNEGDYPYSISSYAFKNVIGLTNVVINDRISAIDSYAFEGCTSLTEITIPNSIVYVGTNAFGRTSLQEFSFNDETIYGNAVLSGCSKLKSVVYNTSQVGANDCAYCYALTSVTLNDVNVIGNNAFRSCSGLTKIVIPETINEISANAFYGCSNLTDIRCLSKSISCNATAFSTISPTGTFTYYCDAAIDSVISSLPESYTKVCVKEFFADYDVIATFNVTDISQPVKLYDGTTNLSSIAIGDNEIGKVSTYNFGKTGEYTVKYKLTATKQPSFKGCNMMTSVELLEGCDTIKYGALQDCNTLSALTLPSTITVISNFAFNNKNNMRIIRCYATTAPEVTTYSFYQVAKNGMLYYPCGSDYSSWLASGSYYLGSLSWSSDCFVPEGTSFYDISTLINVTSTTEPTQLSADEITTQWFTSTPFRYYVDKMYIDGVETTPDTYHTFETTGPHVVGYTLLNKSEVPMAAFSGMTNLTHVELADRITFIAPNAFEATSNLQFINIPDSVTEISNGAFYASGIRYAFIGSGVTTMAWNAMQNCQNLEVIFFKGAQAPSYQGDTFIENPNLAVIGYICGNSPDSFTTLATNIGVESVECITEEELQEFIDSL